MIEKENIQATAQEIFDKNLIADKWEHDQITSKDVMKCIFEAMDAGFVMGAESIEQIAKQSIMQDRRKCFILGMKDAYDALKDFVKEKNSILGKKDDPHTDHVTLHEMNLFFDQYIGNLDELFNPDTIKKS